MPARAQDLEQGFREPPQEARPGTWWHRVNGNISKESESDEFMAEPDDRRSEIAAGTAVHLEYV